MEMTTDRQIPISDVPTITFDHSSTPFEQEKVLITKQELIQLSTPLCHPMNTFYQYFYPKSS